MADTDKYVIRNEDGKFISVFGNGDVIFGNFNPPFTTLFDSENEAREFIRKLVIEGKPIKGQLLVFRYGIIPLHDSEHPGCPHCRDGVSFGGCKGNRYRIARASIDGLTRYFIETEIDSGETLNGEPDIAYGESMYIRACPMCGRNL